MNEQTAPSPSSSPEAQRMREIRELASDPNCQGPLNLLRCNEIHLGANVPTADWCNWCTVRFLVNRADETDEQYQELKAAVTSSDLDHAAVVLIARANAQDSGLVTALEDRAEKLEMSLAAESWRHDECERTMNLSASSWMQRAMQAEAVIAEQAQEIARLRKHGALTNRALADALASTENALASARQEMEQVEIAAASKWGEGWCSFCQAFHLPASCMFHPPSLRADLAASRLRGTTKEKTDAR